jgi:small subunit ribosomal protein S8e
LQWKQKRAKMRRAKRHRGTTTIKYSAPKRFRDLRNYNMRWQGKFGRKPTGGKLIPARGKRKHEVGREQSDTTIAAVRVKKIETRGGNKKMRMLRGDMATVSDPVTGQSKVVKIERVSENKANLHYMRRNILTKGAIVKTEIGEARITNRPGQDGVINAMLLPAT